MAITRSYFTQRQQAEQQFSLLLMVFSVAAITLLCRTADARRSHKRFVIHIPYKIKTHHHTHTVYSVTHSGGMKHQTIYKILGYSKYGRGGYKEYRNERHAGGCPDHKGDMVFNQYSRNDEERFYPDVEAVFDDEQRDEWDR